VKQGALDQALKVYRQLGDANPGDSGIARRIEELESGAFEEPQPPKAAHEEPAAEPEEETETLARELAEGGDGAHDVDSPFAWAEDGQTPEESGDPETGPPVADYFSGLLTWRPGKHS
jgi:hypothetical protein